MMKLDQHRLRTPNILYIKNKLATPNLIPGKQVYGEKLVKKNNKEYRLWNPSRSKLAAAILKGLKNLPLKSDSTMLYLGGASGTTISHLSDILTKGVIFTVEISPEPIRELVFLSEERKNIAPILADANRPDVYQNRIQKCDFLYQDVAQRNQVDILIKNAEFLNENGLMYIAVKARSIDSTMPVNQIFMDVKKQLSAKFKILEELKLEPYEKDHLFLVLKTK
ncbi:fibrillarin-like pre-rRNA processing protein [Methanofollis sp. W23]|uniref:fibrillarin-like rRNA/tRNA 2'-O-methyltransferase n=1 Tax=Methanofollis sp. W23 TaxID=2817849 RepID=UPI001AEAEE67|nr:fibrillarin-like rRNA/tRNA 2'-O-methyltransferase [Methanofollis sp. W23]MBP2145452.1 fibrillarin-like pre-rRNA processing protein [Methanofollis sp. W23]